MIYNFFLKNSHKTLIKTVYTYEVQCYHALSSQHFSAMSPGKRRMPYCNVAIGRNNVDGFIPFKCVNASWSYTRQYQPDVFCEHILYADRVLCCLTC